MEQKSKTVLALEALCDREGGYRSVAQCAGVTPNTLWQVLNGVKLPVSGQPRGLGPGTFRKLSDGFPGWLDQTVERTPDLPKTSTILLSLTDDAVTLGAAFDKSPQEIRDRLHMVLIDYVAQSRREFLLNGTLPQFHQPDRPLAVSQIPTASSNAPEPRAGVQAARSKTRSR